MSQNLSNYEKVRELLVSGLLYTVDDLARIVGMDKPLIRQYIARLRNPDYEKNPVEDVIQIECKDRIKRWGLRTATEIFQS